MKKGITLLLCLTLLFGITVLPVSAEELLIAMKPVMSYRPGDLDGDGSISTADARLCLRSAVGLQQLPDGDLQRNAAASVLHAATASIENKTFTTASARKILRSAIGLDNLNTATAVITDKCGQRRHLLDGTGSFRRKSSGVRLHLQRGRGESRRSRHISLSVFFRCARRVPGDIQTEECANQPDGGCGFFHRPYYCRRITAKKHSKMTAGRIASDRSGS